MKALFALWLVATTTVYGSGYDPEADPVVAYQQALAQASGQDKFVLLVFGSEWCADCRSLGKKLGQAPPEATVDSHFVVAHVDIGN